MWCIFFILQYLCVTAKKRKIRFQDDDRKTRFQDDDRKTRFQDDDSRKSEESDIESHLFYKKKPAITSLQVMMLKMAGQQIPQTPQPEASYHVLIDK